MNNVKRDMDNLPSDVLIVLAKYCPIMALNMNGVSRRFYSVINSVLLTTVRENFIYWDKHCLTETIIMTDTWRKATMIYRTTSDKRSTKTISIVDLYLNIRYVLQQKTKPNE